MGVDVEDSWATPARSYKVSNQYENSRERVTCIAVFGIRIRRIRMFLGLPDLDPLVRDTNPPPKTAPDPSLFS